ncbi:putative major pilin subunit [Oceanobacillus picturae]|uniref:Major pilin subunit n=1 Tax=Oceanobacillus picturae TaxID=171693 RepID=W9AG28_9BACI|nr:prepilin-type N-terminal cleavage/methylation domain-containing protein [Oceanobacillus picturae]CDO01631.1 putative major pilin subunit [Oceanobacillus picturae]
MLTRMKKMLKKEKGFTLVELLAVIAILAIIVAIAVPTIGNVISKSEEKATTANEELVENAARLADVSDVTPATGSAYTIGELKTAGFLDVGDDFELKGTVLVETTTDGGKTFTYTDPK